jgi:hypothetical protein
MIMLRFQGFDASQYAQSLMSDTTVQAVKDTADNTKMIADNAVTVNDNFVTVNTTVSTINNLIADMTSKVHQVTIDLKVNGLDQLNTVGTATGSGTTNSTRNNGGRTPGRDARTSD